jgi:putative monooxygenase
MICYFYVTENEKLGMHESPKLKEAIFSGKCLPFKGSPGGIDLRTFVSSECGATGFSTGTATFRGGAELPFHIHKCGEAITILDGEAVILAESRAYRLMHLDSIFIPAGIGHSVRNGNPDASLIAHCAFSSARPTRTYVEASSSHVEYRGSGQPQTRDPEKVNRFSNAAVYELSNGAYFCDLFAKRLGSTGICGGYGRFTDGASLPCHVHDYDESITIVSGSALCLVQGIEFRLSGLDTAFVPKGKPHRFLNDTQREMAMLWVYSGDEPDRMIVNDGYCSGYVAFPSESRKKM